MAMATAMGIVYYFIAPDMVALFDSDPGVVMYGTMHGRIVCLFFSLMAYSHSVASVCRGAGKAFVPMFVMLGVWCVFRLMYIFTVMHLFGEIQYIFWAYPITWVISSVIYLLYYLFSDWVHGFDTEAEKQQKKLLRQKHV